MEKLQEKGIFISKEELQSNKQIEKLIQFVKDIRFNLNIENSFKEFGLDEETYMSKIDDLANKAFEDQCTTANPRLPLVNELKKILIDAYYGIDL